MKKLSYVDFMFIYPKILVDRKSKRHDSEEKRLTAKWEPEMIDLLNNDLVVHLLTLIMWNIRASKRAPMFMLNGCGGPDERSGLGLTRVEQTLGVKHPESSNADFPLFRGDTDSGVNSFFKAAANTEFPLTKLDICYKIAGGSAFKPDALAKLSSPTFHKLCRSWESLSTLQMGFGLVDGRWFIAEDHGLKSLIECAKNMTSLSLYNDGQVDEETVGADAFSDDNPLGWFSRAFAQHQLAQIELVGFYSRPDQISNFIYEHRRTLRRVEVQNHNIQKDECWTRFLQIVASDLNLEYIFLWRLTRGAALCDILIHDGKRMANLLGTEDITQYANRMLTNGLEYGVEVECRTEAFFPEQTDERSWCGNGLGA